MRKMALALLTAVFAISIPTGMVSAWGVDGADGWGEPPAASIPALPEVTPPPTPVLEPLEVPTPVAPDPDPIPVPTPTVDAPAAPELPIITPEDNGDDELIVGVPDSQASDTVPASGDTGGNGTAPESVDTGADSNIVAGAPSSDAADGGNGGGDAIVAGTPESSAADQPVDTPEATSDTQPVAETQPQATAKAQAPAPAVAKSIVPAYAGLTHTFNVVEVQAPVTAPVSMVVFEAPMTSVVTSAVSENTLAATEGQNKAPMNPVHLVLGFFTILFIASAVAAVQAHGVVISETVKTVAKIVTRRRVEAPAETEVFSDETIAAFFAEQELVS